MFSVEGFIPVSTLRRSLSRGDQGSLERFKKTINDDIAENMRRGLELFFGTSPYDSLESQLLASTRGAMCMCSPSGQILQLDVNEAIYFQAHAAGLFSVLGDLIEHYTNEEVDAFTFRNRLAYFPASYFRKRYFEQIRDGLGTDPTTTLHALSMAGNLHHRIPTYYERNGFTISLKAYDFVREAAPLWSEGVEGVEALRPFEGWSLCLPQSFVDDGWQEGLQRYAGRSEPHPQKGVGRPDDIKRKMRDGYQKAFPNGHGDLSWPKVTNHVNSMMKINGSVETMRRAVESLSVAAE